MTTLGALWYAILTLIGIVFGFFLWSMFVLITSKSARMGYLMGEDNFKEMKEKEKRNR